MKKMFMKNYKIPASPVFGAGGYGIIFQKIHFYQVAHIKNWFTCAPKYTQEPETRTFKVNMKKKFKRTYLGHKFILFFSLLLMIIFFTGGFIPGTFFTF